MPAEGEDAREHMVKKYGMTMTDSIGFQAEITKLGTELGFTFDCFDGMRIVNTRDVHGLLEYAHEVGRQTELKMRLFTAFFTEHKDVSDRLILAQESKRVSLNADEALARLDDQAAQDRILNRETFWRRVGVSSVPTMVFNQSKALNGAQPVHVCKELLTEMIEQLERVAS